MLIKKKINGPISLCNYCMAGSECTCVLCFDTHKSRPFIRWEKSWVGSISWVRLHLVKKKKSQIQSGLCFLNQNASHVVPLGVPRAKTSWRGWRVGQTDPDKVGGKHPGNTAFSLAREGSEKKRYLKMVITCNFLLETVQCIWKRSWGPHLGWREGRVPYHQTGEETRGCLLLSASQFSPTLIIILPALSCFTRWRDVSRTFQVGMLL